MAVETLRPVGNGATSQHTTVTGAASAWDCVDDSSANGDTDFIESVRPGSAMIDLFTLPSNSIPSGATISSVKVFFTARNRAAVKSPQNANKKAVVRENSTTNAEPTGVTNASTTYTQYSYEWTTRPSDNGAWTKADIDSLEIGIRTDNLQAFNAGDFVRYTQVYVEVTYSANVTVLPDSGDVVFEGFAPSINVTDNQTIQPGKADVTFVGHAPTITVTDNQLVSPEKGSLSFEGFAPTITITNYEVTTGKPLEADEPNKHSAAIRKIKDRNELLLQLCKAYFSL